MKKYISEFVGTMMLTLIACGVASIVGCSTIQGIIATSLAFGIVVIVASYSFGHISGAHINPAVSIAFVFAGKMKTKECIKYMISQILGALTGSLILWFIIGSNKVLGANSYNNLLLNGTDVDILRAAIVEIILTFIFVTTILATTSKKEYSSIAGIVIGLTLVVIHIIGIQFTGTSVNPARSIGPAIIQGGKALSQVWLFIVAPIIGSIVASMFYKLVLKEKK